MMSLGLRRAWAIVAAMSMATCVAEARDFYVNHHEGQNGGDGSAGNPWRTISYAMSRVGSGDTLHVSPGNYDVAHGEEPRITLRSGVRVRGAGLEETRIDAEIFIDSPAQFPELHDVEIAGLRVHANGVHTGFVMKDCRLDLMPRSAYFYLENRAILEPHVISCRLQNQSPRIMEWEITGGSTLAGKFLNNFYYLGMDGAHLHDIYLTGGSVMSTEFINNVFEAKQHLGLSFYIGYRQLRPTNTFAPLFLNNTFVVEGFHLMDGIDHDLMLVNNILWSGTEWFRIDADQAWHNLVTDGPYAGINGNIMGDPMWRDHRFDFRPAPESPVIDAGMLHPRLFPYDDGLAPRVLDGDGDRTPEVDIGAFEFAPAYLTTPERNFLGGTMELTIEDGEGFQGALFVGVQQAVIPFGSWGSLLFRPVNLTRPYFIGSLPATLSVPIPDEPAYEGITVMAQVLAFQPRTREGALSNAVSFTLTR